MLKKESKRIFLSPPHMGGEELHFVREAFESNYIAPLGPQVDSFEREFAETVGIRHAVAVSSGTAAMHLALRILAVGPGDEVFASTLTFIGSVTPIVFQGGTPVFIDSDRASWNMDPDLLGQELEACHARGRLPKAVVPTDLYGQCADLDRIVAVCSPYGIPVVVDAAEALGAQYKNRCAGAGAAAAVFSFNGNKIITTSGGGMLASDDRELIEQARFLAQQARDPAPHYEHSQIGYNYRMSNVAAAIGRGQLRVLDERVTAKRSIFQYYRTHLADLPGIDFMPEAPYGRCTRWLTVILVSPELFGTDREAIRLALETENIESRPIWKPMHLQPVFAVNAPRVESVEASRVGSGPKASESCAMGHVRYSARAVGGAVSEGLFERGLCLPSGTQMTEEDLAQVVGIIRKLRR
jgi:dTDP-4-amino-4,6-dideoxygalactose transaminase